MDWREWILAAMTAGGIAAALWIPPIPQDPAYHLFADQRTILGIPNFANVLSNLLFVLTGIFGLSKAARLQPSPLYAAFVVFCIGVVLTGFGSTYYHVSPSTRTLAWDRLPMAIAFMALFSMVICDRMPARCGKGLLWPLVFVGMGSVGYWHWSELQGRGDLRPYGVVQFLPMLLMPLMLIFYRGKGLHTSWLWGSFGAYGLAKVAEHYDRFLYTATGIISGHSCKHILAALAVLGVLFAAQGLRR